MSENSRIAAQSRRIVRLLAMNRDEQRRRLEAEAERDRLREALTEIAEQYGDGVSSQESRIARAALEKK